MSSKCSHREFYSQFVTNYHKRIVLNAFGLERLKKHFELVAFNTLAKGRIEIDEWNRLAPLVTVNMKPCGSYLTLVGQVCILKEAAKQVVEKS